MEAGRVEANTSTWVLCRESVFKYLSRFILKATHLMVSCRKMELFDDKTLFGEGVLDLQGKYGEIAGIDEFQTFSRK